MSCRVIGHMSAGNPVKSMLVRGASTTDLLGLVPTAEHKRLAQVTGPNWTSFLPVGTDTVQAPKRRFKVKVWAMDNAQIINLFINIQSLRTTIL
jgi:hypothetical protein